MIKSYLTTEEFDSYIKDNRSKINLKLKRREDVHSRRRYRKERRNALLEALKDKRIDISGIVYDKVHCVVCRNIKLRYRNQEDRPSIYRDEFNKKWEGRKCPTCFKNKIDEDNEKKLKKYEEKPCLTCKNLFKPKIVTSNYCSKECSYKSKKIPRYCKTCNTLLNIPSSYCSKKCRPLKNKEKKEYSNTCFICGNVWISNRKGKCCSKKCKAKKYRIDYPDKVKANNKKYNKEPKRLRKRAERKRKLKSVKWSEIEGIYKNCPEGFQVDHIIPLNHPNVSGLHVPWNLQYLSLKENQVKSNSFDGTYENLSWKKKL